MIISIDTVCLYSLRIRLVFAASPSDKDITMVFPRGPGTCTSGGTSPAVFRERFFCNSSHEVLICFLWSQPRLICSHVCENHLEQSKKTVGKKNIFLPFFHCDSSLLTQI